MKAIKGKITDKLEANVVYAETQEEYYSLPAHKTKNGLVTFAFGLTKDEFRAIENGNRIYVSVMTFNQPLQPIYLTTSPFEIELFVEINGGEKNE